MDESRLNGRVMAVSIAGFSAYTGGDAARRVRDHRIRMTFDARIFLSRVNSGTR